MRKVVWLLLCIVSVCFVGISADTVCAKTSITASLNSKVDKVKKGEEIVITLRFSNYDGIKKGINTYKAALKYDREVFEEVELKDFKNKSGWENLKYNKSTGEFVAIKKIRTKVDEDVVQITFKVKNNVKPGNTVITLNDMMASEGKDDILLNNVSKTISIIENNENTSVDKLENSSSQSTKTDKLDKVSSSSNDKENSDDLDDNNDEESNNDNDNQDNKKDDSDSEKVNKNESNPLYFVLVGAIVFASGTLVGYFINKSNQIKFNSTGVNNFKGESVSNDSIVDNTNTNNDNNDNVDNTSDSDSSNDDDNSGNNGSSNVTMLIFLLLGSILLQFIGGSVVYAQTLDIDSNFDYEDVDFLQRCLIHLEDLSEDELKAVDVNGDGKITAADVTLTVQVIEDILDYDVELFNFEFNNYYPLKGDTLELIFDGEISYGAKIEKLVINSQEYDVKFISDRYLVSLNAGIKAGIKEFNITEAILNNGKTVEIDYVQKVDVLKAMPRVENYSVVENIRDQKLIVSFDINDKDNSVVNSTFKVFDENSKLVKSMKLAIGRNIVEFDVQDGKKYRTDLEISYDLDTNELDEKKDNTGIIRLEKDLTLVTDYKFKIENIETYKDGVKNSSFNRNEKIELRFESTNSTKYEPVRVRVNGITYNVEKNADKYVVVINGFSDSGNNNIIIEEVILENGKSFELSSNNNVFVNVIKVKQKPSVSNLVVSENENNLKVQFMLKDEDDTIMSAVVVLYNENNVEIGRQYLSSTEIKSGNIVKNFLTDLLSSCKVKINVTYRLSGNVAFVSETLAEEVFKASVKAIITDSVSSNIYPVKRDIITLTYGIETNSLVDIYKVRINNIDCMVRKTVDGKYKLIYQVKNTSGIEELVATEIIYKDNSVSKVYNVIKVDVLKEKPIVSEVLKTENIEKSEVNFGFDIIDNDNSFISGKAVLTNLLDGTVVEKDVVSGHNDLSFKVVGGMEYNLDINYTYDLDTSSLEETDTTDNRVTESIIEAQKVYLDVISNIVDDSDVSYNLTNCSIYFRSNGVAVLRFRTENDIDLELCKMSINGKMYDITKDGIYYVVELYDMDAALLNSILMSAILGNKDIISIKHNNTNSAVVVNTNDELFEVNVDTFEDIK